MQVYYHRAVGVGRKDIRRDAWLQTTAKEIILAAKLMKQSDSTELKLVEIEKYQYGVRCKYILGLNSKL